MPRGISIAILLLTAEILLEFTDANKSVQPHRKVSTKHCQHRESLKYLISPRNVFQILKYHTLKMSSCLSTALKY